MCVDPADIMVNEDLYYNLFWNFYYFATSVLRFTLSDFIVILNVDFQLASVAY